MPNQTFQTFQSYLDYADVFRNPVKVQYLDQTGHWRTYSTVRTTGTMQMDLRNVRMLYKLSDSDTRVIAFEGYILH